MYKIVRDIGGTNIKVAVINDDLEMIDYKKIKTPDNFHIRIVDETYKLVEGFVNQYQLKIHLSVFLVWCRRFRFRSNYLHGANHSKL